MYRYKLVLAYDGTNYSGWQVQPNATSIQFLVQEALSTALRTPTHATGSGRTDAGVHALGQTAHFTTQEPQDTHKLLASLNGLLSDEIRILSIEEVARDFHARFDASGKIYHYRLHLDRVPDPFKRLYSTHIHTPLDLNLVKAGCALFVGTHDFTSFANEAHRGSAAKDAVRTIKRLDLVEEPGGVRLEFEADGFLYKMVRNITGTLIEVGRGRLTLEEVERIMRAKDRKEAASSAPPQGLFLIQVHY
ncbi:MAG: tRNA pseudouridine(38-40) synthase TruA [Chlamydiales bacterium]|nr:tRNA pseudouridine(38-40) synthase TruA [Chlamydiales bacterium]